MVDTHSAIAEIRRGKKKKKKKKIEDKTRKPLKLAGVPQTNETISAASRLKFTIL